MGGLVPPTSLIINASGLILIFKIYDLVIYCLLYRLSKFLIYFILFVYFIPHVWIYEQ